MTKKGNKNTTPKKKVIVDPPEYTGFKNNHQFLFAYAVQRANLLNCLGRLFCQFSNLLGNDSNPPPASPARAASIATFNAKRFVWSAILVIVSTKKFTPTMNLMIDLANLVHQTDYREKGRTLSRLQLEGVCLGDLKKFVTDGTPFKK